MTAVHGTVSGQHMNKTDKNRYNECFHKKLQMEVSETELNLICTETLNQ